MLIRRGTYPIAGCARPDFRRGGRATVVRLAHDVNCFGPIGWFVLRSSDRYRRGQRKMRRFLGASVRSTDVPSHSEEFSSTPYRSRNPPLIRDPLRTNWVRSSLRLRRKASRCGGPLRATSVDLASSGDQTDAQNADSQIALGVSALRALMKSACVRMSIRQSDRRAHRHEQSYLRFARGPRPIYC
jgi:hypothetical protein